MNSMVKDNLSTLRTRIIRSCEKSNRDVSDVKILLATKTVPAEKILLAFAEGETLIGENKVQELKEKHEVLSAVPHQSHFIGHLQTNKIKDVLKYAECIQSVDRIDLAKKLDLQLRKEGRKLDIMLQINTSLEESKFGVNPADAICFAKSISHFDTLNVTGLMTIGLFSANASEVRKCFQLLKQLYMEIDALKLANFDLRELSMGMSDDLEIAIEEGATIIRIGTALFGDRIYPDSYYWNEKTK